MCACVGARACEFQNARAANSFLILWFKRFIPNAYFLNCEKKGPIECRSSMLNQWKIIIDRTCGSEGLYIDEHGVYKVWKSRPI
jgi:hypothetical protein